jgi:phospholipase C
MDQVDVGMHKAATWQRVGQTARVVGIGVSLLAGCLGPQAPAAPQTAAQTAQPNLKPPPLAVPGAERIEHIVVIYMENHSFDNLYGHFPGAEGLDPPATTATQTDPQGRVYASLPPVVNTGARPRAPDPRFPAQLPNAPFLIDRFVPIHERVPDPVHRFYQHREQINGGRLDRFVAAGDSGALPMGYHDIQTTALYGYARRFMLLDHFFQAAFGGSLLNHLWLVCACAARHPDASADMRVTLDGQGHLVKDGAYSPDGYVVNNVFPQGGPYPRNTRDVKRLVPPQSLPTIGDRLSEKGISWAWYAGGWNDSLAGGRPVSIVVPLLYFAPYGPGTPGRRLHVKDEADFVQAIESNSLPAVAFYKPAARDDQHPGYTDLVTGDRHVADLIARIEHSPAWASTVILVTYDEYGGYWDHVPPPAGDRWGPGTRIPAIILSPFARPGTVDHTVYDTTSILAMIESRFGLAPLASRDAHANNPLHALDFSRHSG